MRGVKLFRRDLREWFSRLRNRKSNSYRRNLVIPKGTYKGLGWGIAWSAERVLGPDDPDTKAAWKTVFALLRLSSIQERRHRKWHP